MCDPMMMAVNTAILLSERHSRRPTPKSAPQASRIPWDALRAPPKEGTTTCTHTLIAAGIGALLLGLAAGAPAQAGLSVNGVGLAATAQGESGALEVPSVMLPAPAR